MSISPIGSSAATLAQAPVRPPAPAAVSSAVTASKSAAGVHPPVNGAGSVYASKGVKSAGVDRLV